MHEMGITKILVESITEECEKKKIKNPKKITIELGGLTSYRKGDLLFNFDHIKPDYPLIADIELIVNEIKGRIKCNECNKDSDVDYSEIIQCPHCESIDIKVLQGKDIKITSVEI